MGEVEGPDHPGRRTDHHDPNPPSITCAAALFPELTHLYSTSRFRIEQTIDKHLILAARLLFAHLTAGFSTPPAHLNGGMKELSIPAASTQTHTHRLHSRLCPAADWPPVVGVGFALCKLHHSSHHSSPLPFEHVRYSLRSALDERTAPLLFHIPGQSPPDAISASLRLSILASSNPARHHLRNHAPIPASLDLSISARHPLSISASSTSASLGSSKPPAQHNFTSARLHLSKTPSRQLSNSPSRLLSKSTSQQFDISHLDKVAICETPPQQACTSDSQQVAVCASQRVAISARLRLSISATLPLNFSKPLA
ncbi:hypothetical protein BST61_g11495 [Cercospora zeina]